MRNLFLYSAIVVVLISRQSARAEQAAESSGNTSAAKDIDMTRAFHAFGEAVKKTKDENEISPVPDRSSHVAWIKKTKIEINKWTAEQIAAGRNIDEVLRERDAKLQHEIWEVFARKRAAEYSAYRQLLSDWDQVHGDLVSQISARQWHSKRITIQAPNRDMRISKTPAPEFDRSSSRDPFREHDIVVEQDRSECSIKLEAKDRYKGEARSVIGGSLRCAVEFQSSFVDASVAADRDWLVNETQ
jgi:hypothetical protein